MLNMTVYLCKGSDASNGKMLFLLRAIGEDRFCQYYDFKLTFRCNPLQVIKCIHELHLWSHKFLLSLKRGRLLREKTSNCKSIVLALFILIWIASSAWCCSAAICDEVDCSTLTAEQMENLCWFTGDLLWFAPTPFASAAELRLCSGGCSSLREH